MLSSYPPYIEIFEPIDVKLSALVKVLSCIQEQSYLGGLVEMSVIPRSSNQGQTPPGVPLNHTTSQGMGPLVVQSSAMALLNTVTPENPPLTKRELHKYCALAEYVDRDSTFFGIVVLKYSIHFETPLLDTPSLDISSGLFFIRNCLRK